MFHGHIVTPVTPNNSVTFNNSLTPSQSLMSVSSPHSTQSMPSLSCTPQSIKSTPGSVVLEEERSGTEEEWKVAWCNWAFSRKRGKLAQFIIRNLQIGDYSRWLDPKHGKFEIRDWQTLARIWYSEKERTSEEMDATSIFKKGLSKAFPNLQEVKHMSIKEGTLYKTRVFEAPRELCDEVYKFVKNPRAPAIPLICSHYPNTTNPTLLEQYQFQPQHITNSVPFPLQHNNNQIFTDVSFPHLKRESNIQQYHQPQQMAPIKLFSRPIPHQVHPGQIIQQQSFIQQQECIHPVQQNGINMMTTNPATVYTIRESDQVVPGTRFSTESSSYYSQVDPETSNQPYTQCETDEFVEMPCKPSPGSDNLNLAPSPNVHPFEENASNISGNMYPGTGSSFSHRSPNTHIDSPLMDQKEAEHVLHQQIPEQAHVLITHDYYEMQQNNANAQRWHSEQPIPFSRNIQPDFQTSFKFMNSPNFSNLIDIRITPVHSPIQGGGDLCIVFSQQDNSVPRGEKFLYFDSAIDPHLVPITQDMGYALFTQIPAHIRSEALRIHVILAEDRAKIASAEFTYTDSNYSPYTIEVLKGLTSNLVSNEHYKSITGDFSQFHSSQQQQQAPNQFYNHPGYNPMYKMLVLAAGLGIEPLLYVLLQPRTSHSLLLIPSPAGLLPEDYAQKFGHHKISVCLSLVRKQFERTNGVHNDETEEGDSETQKRETKSTFYPKGDPLELINRGGAVPAETIQSIMNYLAKLVDPAPTETKLSTSPPLPKSASEEVVKKPLTTQKSPRDSITKQDSASDNSIERGQMTPKLAHASSSKNLGDSGYGPSFETSVSRDGGDAITGELTLLSGPKFSRKCPLGSINSINFHKTDRLLESEAIDLINQEMDSLRLEGKPIVLTARSDEFDATLKLEPLQSAQDSVKVSESREVTIVQSEDSSFGIVGGNQTGIFVHSVKNAIKHQLSPGDQIFSLNGESFQSLTGFEALKRIATLPNDESFDLTVSQNKFRYSKTLSQNDSWDSFYVRTNFYIGTSLLERGIWHVVNSLYTPDSWRVWRMGDQGREVSLMEIPNPDRVQKMQCEVIDGSLPHFTYLNKIRSPKARPVVLMGQQAGELKDKLLDHHRNKFSHFKSEEHFQASLQKHTHPVIVAQGRKELADLAHLHPIVIMCESRSSVTARRSPQTFFPDSDPHKDVSYSHEFVKLEGSSIEDFRLQAIDAVSREQNSPVWSTVN